MADDDEVKLLKEKIERLEAENEAIKNQLVGLRREVAQLKQSPTPVQREQTPPVQAETKTTDSKKSSIMNDRVQRSEKKYHITEIDSIDPKTNLVSLIDIPQDKVDKKFKQRVFHFKSKTEGTYEYYVSDRRGLLNDPGRQPQYLLPQSVVRADRFGKTFEESQNLFLRLDQDGEFYKDSGPEIYYVQDDDSRGQKHLLIPPDDKLPNIKSTG